MERDARRAAGLPGVEPGGEDEDDDSDSEEILDLVPEVLQLFCFVYEPVNSSNTPNSHVAGRRL